MTSIELTASETTILFVLMAEGRDVTNTEVRALGPELTKSGREKLNRAGLVQSQLIARRYLHSLTDDGWAWCAANLGAEPPARSTPLSRALFTVLQGLDRGIRASDALVSEVFAPRGGETAVAPVVTTSSATDDTGPDGVVEQRIRDAYARLTPRPAGLVGLTEIRSALSDVARDDIDRGLLALQRVPGVNVIPESNRKTLTDEDRRAAVSIGGQQCHLISIREDL